VSVHTKALEEEIRVLQWTLNQLQTQSPGRLRGSAIKHVSGELAEKKAKLQVLNALHD
jgi:hypothetical protein